MNEGHAALASEMLAEEDEVDRSVSEPAGRFPTWRLLLAKLDDASCTRTFRDTARKMYMDFIERHGCMPEAGIRERMERLTARVIEKSKRLSFVGGGQMLIKELHQFDRRLREAPLLHWVIYVRRAFRKARRSTAPIAGS